MENIKKEKTKSFWLGVLTGAGVTGVIMTVVACVLIVVQAQTLGNYLPGRSSGGSGGSFSLKPGTSQSTSSSEIITDDVIKKIDKIDSLIDQNFYFTDNVDIDAMQTEIYRAVLASLDDPYSVYYTPEELSAMFEESDGTYYGIGSYVTMDEDRGLPMLSGVFEESPAQRAGLRDGDFIYEVDRQSITDLTLTEVVSLIKGPEGTDVELTIIREGEDDYLYITVTRGKVETPTVKHRMLDNNIGYLQITEFDDVTLSQFEEAYADLQANGMKAMVLDLRSNPGGNLDTVVGICDDILPKGTITYTIDKYGNREDYTCKGKHEIDIPLAVLVNGYSASASELLTGAVRDYKIGTIIGTNTFGKGIVQQIFSVGDGSGIKLTTSRYYTPNGECIHGVGIAPDIEVELDTELYYSDEAIDNQLDAAVDYLMEQIN